jgi:PhoH-like ATPase
LDTNVLLHNPHAIYAFAENNVAIPLPVIEEIDNCKKAQNEIGRNARIVSRELDLLRQVGRLSEGVCLKNEGRLWIELNHQQVEGLPVGLDSSKYDNRILAVAKGLLQEEGGRVILVTKDLNLRIKADVIGLPAEDFHADTIEYRELYSGSQEKYIDAEKMALFFNEGCFPWPDSEPPCPNSFVILKITRWRTEALHLRILSNCSNRHTAHCNSAPPVPSTSPSWSETGFSDGISWSMNNVAKTGPGTVAGFSQVFPTA